MTLVQTLSASDPLTSGDWVMICIACGLAALLIYLILFRKRKRKPVKTPKVLTVLFSVAFGIFFVTLANGRDTKPLYLQPDGLSENPGGAAGELLVLIAFSFALGFIAASALTQIGHLFRSNDRLETEDLGDSDDGEKG